jgi:hypothetical protein
MKIQAVIRNHQVEHFMSAAFPDDPQHPVAVDLDEANELHPVLNADIFCLDCGQPDEAAWFEVWVL